MTWGKLQSAWVLVLGLCMWPMLCACGGQLEAQTRGGLAVVARVVEPSSLAAHDACVAAGDAVIAGARAGALAPEDARAALAAVHSRCDRIDAAYGAVRALHDAAADALESGSVARAAELLAELTVAWERIREAAR